MQRIDGEKKEIVLFGYGKFGKQMYKHLKNKGHEVVLATSDDNNHKDATNDNITDVRHFTPKRNDSIKQLNLNPQTQLFYCTMDHTSYNLFLVLSLRELFHDATIVAVSNSEENTRKLQYAGANTIIDIYEASAQHIITNITKPAVAEALNNIVFEDNDLKIAEITLDPNSTLEKKRASSVDFYSRGLILIAIIDKELSDKLIYINKGIDHIFDAGDTLVFAGKTEDIVNFKKELTTF
jgi:voltage-gated potassium channel